MPFVVARQAGGAKRVHHLDDLYSDIVHGIRVAVAAVRGAGSSVGRANYCILSKYFANDP